MVSQSGKAERESASLMPCSMSCSVREANQKRTAYGGIELNPPRDASLQLNKNDDLIVFATYN